MIEERVLLDREAPHLDTSNVRLVFLDIDGVLNSMKTCLYAGVWPYLETKETGRTTELKFREGMDIYAIKLLDMLLSATNAHIVLSSTWRIGLDVYQCRDFLGDVGLDPKRVIGKTGNGPGTRGEQIFNYLQGLGEKRSSSGADYYVQQGLLVKPLEKTELNVVNYVILDDSSDFTEDQLSNHLVRTMNNDGLGLSETLHAGKILTGHKFGIDQLVHGETSTSTILTFQ